MLTNLENWFKQWSLGISASPIQYVNPFDTVDARQCVTGLVEEKIKQLRAIFERCSAPRAVELHPTVSSSGGIDDMTFQGPGELRVGGPRHDNDLVSIEEIKIAPTHSELLSEHDPYLPYNFHGAEHHEEAESMSRLLDIQFRLMREELVYVFPLFLAIGDSDQATVLHCAKLSKPCTKTSPPLRSKRLNSRRSSTRKVVGTGQQDTTPSCSVCTPVSNFRASTPTRGV